MCRRFALPYVLARAAVRLHIAARPAHVLEQASFRLFAAS